MAPQHSRARRCDATPGRTLDVFIALAMDNMDGVAYSDWAGRAMLVIGISKDTFRRIVNELEQLDLAWQDPRDGLYRLPRFGREYAEELAEQ